MEKKSKKRCGYVTKTQKIALIDFVENHKNLLLKKLDNVTAIKEAAKTWEQGAIILNAIPGSFKSWQNWRKCWQDMRNEVRTKVAQIKREVTITGGETSKQTQLNESEERIRDLIGEACIYGHASVPEKNTIQMEFAIEDNLPDFIKVEENYASSMDSEATSIEYLARSPDATVESNKIEISTVESLGQNQQTTQNDSNRPSVKKRKRSVAAQCLTETINTPITVSKPIEQKLDAKGEYYKVKLELLERMVKAKEASSLARQRIATSLENLEKTTKEMADYIKLTDYVNT